MLPPLYRLALAGLLLATSSAAATVATAQSPQARTTTTAERAAPQLTLRDALARASAADPSLDAAAARAAAAEAAVRQAGVKPNPSLGLEVENFAGTGPYSLLDRNETTLSYERTFERGGKREARTDRARAEVRVVRLRAEVKRLDFIRDVQLAYADVLAAEAELLVAEARLISAEKSRADIARRVRSARDPLFAGSRAEALTAQAAIARDQARQTLSTAKVALATYWAGGPQFTVNLDDFFNVSPPTNVETGASPDLALLDGEREVTVAALRVERSRDVADPTLRGGVRYFGEGSEVALVVGGSIPLGVARTNRANVERAEAERSAAEADIAAARAVRQREAARLVARMQALASEAERIRAEVIPHAIRTVDQVTAGFNRGGFEYLDVTEAERALGDARARRVEVLRDYHAAQAALDRLTARHAALLTPINEERR